jgi:phosphatidate cytidylyltransferase
MAMNWPTFFKRAGSAVIFCIVMLTGLMWNDYAFLILLLLIQFLCLREYFNLIGKIYPEKEPAQALQALIQLCGIGFLLFSFRSFMAGQVLWPALLFFPVLILLTESLSAKGSPEHAFRAFGALLYISLPMILLLQLREKSLILPLGLIALIWINDTMAYIVGSFIGKTPFSAISPKKTWEGTAGGALLTAIAAAVWGYYSPYYHIQDWIVLALCAAIAGTMGDLLESKLKRLAQVKDSGNIMPGHGGALDRFDSLLVAVPFAFAYAWLFLDILPVRIF